MEIHGKDGCSVAARRNTCSIVSIDMSAQSSALINLGRFWAGWTTQADWRQADSARAVSSKRNVESGTDGFT